jgi:opacity protein-like surface antigen
MKKILVAIAAAVAFFSSAQAAEKTPEEACQAQASVSIASKWPKVLKGQFQIIVKGNRCLVFLQAPVVIQGKRTAWLVDGNGGELLAEFTAPTTGAAWKDSDRGLCSYRGGKFKTGECTWGEYLDQADQM